MGGRADVRGLHAEYLGPGKRVAGVSLAAGVCGPEKATEGTYKVHGAFDPAVRVVLPNSDPRGT